MFGRGATESRNQNEQLQEGVGTNGTLHDIDILAPYTIQYLDTRFTVGKTLDVQLIRHVEAETVSNVIPQGGTGGTCKENEFLGM